MCFRCVNGLLAIVILVFSFWIIDYSELIIIVAAAAIVIIEVYFLISQKEGYSCFGGKTGSSAIMEETKKGPEPSKEEVKEVLKAKK